MDYKISVVIPAYNAERHIAEAIRSALEQEYPAHEIIVVNDGSTDNTEKVVNPYCKDGIIYLFQQNGGPSKARNSGILRSSGNLIAFLDADDLWYPNHLSDAINFFNTNPDILWFTSAFNIESPDHRLKQRIIKSESDAIDYFKYTLRNSIVHTSAVVIHRQIFKSVGLFNENFIFGEDLNLWVRIALRYPEIGYSKNPGSVFRKTRDSLTFNKQTYDLKNTLKVLYFTDKEVETAGNTKAIRLIDQWIEDAVFSAILNKNKLILEYFNGRWEKRIGKLIRVLVLTHNYIPPVVVRVIQKLNRTFRKYSIVKIQQ